MFTKLQFSMVIVAILIFTRSACADTFANPLDVRLADPQVLYDGGTYYLYHTSSSNGFRVWTSADLVNWRYRGFAYTKTASSWGRTSLWAPEVVKHNGFYYMVYSAAGGSDGYKRICVAKSASPLGPFVDEAAPLFDDGQGWIDGHIFFDTDGQIYLYCTQALSDPPDNESFTYVAKFNNTLTGLTTGLTLCLSPSANWEGGSNKWNEAPFIVKHNGYYYLLYSGHSYATSAYAVGYATATNPLGPWTKFSGNPIVRRTASTSGPGHCAVIQSPDGTELWMIYHTHQQLSGGGARQLAIDKIAFVDQPTGFDHLTVPGAPSSTMQAAPSGAPPFPLGGDDEFSGTALNRNRWLVFNEAGSRFAIANGVLDATTRVGNIYQADSADQENILLQYPPYPDFEIETKVNFLPGENFEQASLFVWQDHNNYIRLSKAWIAGRKFEVGVEVNAVFAAQQEPTDIGADCWMRIRKSDNIFTFWVSGNGINWQQMAESQTVNFIDIKVGLGASSPGSGRALSAKFDYFHIQAYTSDVNDWSLY